MIKILKFFGIYARKKHVQWIVNNLGELGVKVGTEFFFMYKGEPFQYDKETLKLIKYRQVEKREFGESCHVSGWSNNSKDLYIKGENWKNF